MSNDMDSISNLTKQLQELVPQQIIVESTGGYEINLVAKLFKTGLPVARVNPLRVRRFYERKTNLADECAWHWKDHCRYLGGFMVQYGHKA